MGWLSRMFGGGSGSKTNLRESMRSFSDACPGCTIQEVESLLGPASRKHRLDDGDSCYQWIGTGSDIMVQLYWNDEGELTAGSVIDGQMSSDFIKLWDYVEAIAQ